jgi:phosphoglycolate phosphatase-like HAD superfamily hydrolase
MLGNVPIVLALDFDGVICDGLKEYFITAWLAYCQIWQPDNQTPPEGMAEQFYRLRPVVETGWEMPVLLRLIQQGFSEETLWREWAAIAQRTLVQEELKPAPLAAAVDGVRDHWISTNLSGWLAEHRFYPGVIEQVQKWLSSGVQVFIISTKEGRFIDQLLQQQGVELPQTQIFGKESNRPKHQVLRELLQKFADRGTFLEEEPVAVWFVEDRLRTLQAIKQQPDLASVQLFLADWGYNTPTDREIAQQDDRIHLVSLHQFTQDHPTFLQSFAPAYQPSDQRPG